MTPAVKKDLLVVWGWQAACQTLVKTAVHRRDRMLDSLPLRRRVDELARCVLHCIAIDSIKKGRSDVIIEHGFFVLICARSNERLIVVAHWSLLHLHDGTSAYLYDVLIAARTVFW